MLKRDLFLVGYDVSCPQRLQRALRAVRIHALGGQKSFYECWLSRTELDEVMQALRGILDPDTDRAILVRLPPHTESVILGDAQPIDHGDFILVE